MSGARPLLGPALCLDFPDPVCICRRSLVAVEKVQCNGKAYLVDRANRVVYDFEDGLNEVLDPEPVSELLLLLAFLLCAYLTTCVFLSFSAAFAHRVTLARRSVSLQVGTWVEERKTIELYAVTQD